VQEKRDSSCGSTSGDLRKGGRLIDSSLPYIGVSAFIHYQLTLLSDFSASSKPAAHPLQCQSEIGPPFHHPVGVCRNPSHLHETPGPLKMSFGYLLSLNHPSLSLKSPSSVSLSSLPFPYAPSYRITSCIVTETKSARLYVLLRPRLHSTAQQYNNMKYQGPTHPILYQHRHQQQDKKGDSLPYHIVFLPFSSIHPSIYLSIPEGQHWVWNEDIIDE
jgi:hypothetical protein